MAFDPLPSASSFASALATIENQLAALDKLLATFTFSATSSDGNITVVADASIAIDAITISASLLTGSTALTTLASSIVTVANQALASAHTKAISQVATSVAAFNLQGVCVPNGAQPNFAGFAPAAATLTAEEPALDTAVAEPQFTGKVGVA